LPSSAYGSSASTRTRIPRFRASSVTVTPRWNMARPSGAAPAEPVLETDSRLALERIW